MFENVTHPFYKFLDDSKLPESYRYFYYNDINEYQSKWPDNHHYGETKRMMDEYSKNPNRFIKYNWIDSENNLIFPTYSVNKYGFRTNIEYKDNVDLAIGCSYTFGLGNHEEHIWPSILSKEIKKQIINLGIPGGGMDSSYRILKSYLNDYKVNTVYFLIPSAFRYEFVYRNSNDKTTQHLRILPNASSWLEGEEKELYNSTWDSIYSLEDNMYSNFYKNLEAIRYLCIKNKVRLVEYLNPAMYNQDDVLVKNGWDFIENCSSFDNLHHGPELHEFITEQFLKII